MVVFYALLESLVKRHSSGNRNLSSYTKSVRNDAYWFVDKSRFPKHLAVSGDKLSTESALILVLFHSFQMRNKFSPD